VRRGEIPRRVVPPPGQCSPDQFGSPNQFGLAAGQRQDATTSVRHNEALTVSATRAERVLPRAADSWVFQCLWKMMWRRCGVFARGVSAPCSTALPRQNAQNTSDTQDTLRPNQIALLDAQYSANHGWNSYPPLQIQGLSPLFG
jgi:hypothetical protein